MPKAKKAKKVAGIEALSRQVVLLVNKVKKEKDGKKKYARELDNMEHAINEFKKDKTNEKPAKELKMLLDEVK